MGGGAWARGGEGTEREMSPRGQMVQGALRSRIHFWGLFLGAADTDHTARQQTRGTRCDDRATTFMCSK